MNGPHRVLEAAMEYGNLSEELRRELRADLGYQLAVWSMDFIEMCPGANAEGGACEVTEHEEPLLPDGWTLERDPDLCIIRDERGNVVRRISGESATDALVEKIALDSVIALRDGEAGG